MPASFVRVFDALQPVLAPPEQRDVVHRAGPVERDERDDVAEVGRLHRRQRAPHPFRFQLEHAHRIADWSSRYIGIVPRQRGQVDRDPALAQQVHRLAQHRQRLEAKEVELHQPQILDMLHVELGHRHVRTRIAVERDELRQRPVADHHAGRVGGTVARQPFELHGKVDQPLDLGIAVIFALQFRHAVQRARQRPGSVGWLGTILHSRSTWP
jgi:hypothetical protein